MQNANPYSLVQLSAVGKTRKLVNLTKSSELLKSFSLSDFSSEILIQVDLDQIDKKEKFS